jgi:FixJ family two-component response regulator
MKTTHQTVFFVDDEPHMRTAIAYTLGKEGYDVTCFANGNACLKEIEQTGCNLLISDFKMPGMDGMELLSRVRRTAPWIPVIILTAHADIQMAVYAMKIGAADFIEKPVNNKILVQKVEEVLSRNEFNNGTGKSMLTKTEKMVLKLILDGCSNKEIALKLGCALRTVEFHHSHIYRKFRVDNPVELTKKALAMLSSEKSS